MFGIDPAVRMALAPLWDKGGGQRILLVKALPLRVNIIISHETPECKFSYRNSAGESEVLWE